MSSGVSFVMLCEPATSGIDTFHMYPAVTLTPVDVGLQLQVVSMVGFIARVEFHNVILLVAALSE